MNAMNRSGHSEMPDPDWFARETDRAKVSPSTLETDQSTVLNNSLASLNLDSFHFTDLPTNDHYSVRSLPVIPSSGDNNSIAYQPDAPWNESPQSFRSFRSNRPRMTAQTLLANTKPPQGVSAIDHLNNSISSLNLNGTVPPMQSIITEGVYEIEDSDGEDASQVSLRVADLTGRPTPEMDATAHAGNVSRTTNNHLSPQRSMRNNNSYSQQQHASPLPSPQRSMRGPYISGNSSIVGSSITTRASVRFQQMRQHNASFSNNNNNNSNINNEPSISTLGDDDQEDDDNMAIIKLLRTQVNTLKQQLLAEQQKNQEQKLLLQQSQTLSSGKNNGKNHSSFSASSTCSSIDSFGCCDNSESESIGNESVKDSNNGDAAVSIHKKKLSDAEEGVLGSIAALKESLRKQQEKEPSPVAAADSSDDAAGAGTEDEQLLLDELVLCELENHYKLLRQEQATVHQELRDTNVKLAQQAGQQAARIAELERQLKS